jgi:hypothetical protein
MKRVAVPFVVERTRTRRLRDYLALTQRQTAHESSHANREEEIWATLRRVCRSREWKGLLERQIAPTGQVLTGLPGNCLRPNLHAGPVSCIGPGRMDHSIGS